MTSRALSTLLSRCLLGFAALLHSLLAISLIAFLLLLSPAAAQEGAAAGNEPPLCEGRDILGQLAEKRPDLLQEARRQAAETPNGEGRFWRIEKTGLAPSYLFGTMHLTDPRVLDLPPAVSEALDGADRLVVESVGVLSPSAMSLAMVSRPSLFVYTEEGESLDAELGETLSADLRAEMERRGMKWWQVSMMRPHLVSAMVAIPACEQARQAAGMAFLDSMLASRASEAEKPVEGLETIGEQMAALSDLPVEHHVRGIEMTLRLGDDADDMLETMVDLYLEERIALIVPAVSAYGEMVLGEDEKDNIADNYEAFERRVITMRNHGMAESSVPFIDQGGTFIAVGALHLPGEDGLVDLLRGEGYRVTRIPLVN